MKYRTIDGIGKVPLDFIRKATVQPLLELVLAQMPVGEPVHLAREMYDGVTRNIGLELEGQGFYLAYRFLREFVAYQEMRGMIEQSDGHTVTRLK